MTVPMTVRIRNILNAVHRLFKARAAPAGTMLSDLLRGQLIAAAALSSEAELKAHLAAAEPFAMAESSASLARRERDAA